MNFLSCFFIFTCNTLRIRSFVNYDGWLSSRNSSTEILHFQQNEFCPVNRELFTSRKDRTLSFDTDLWQLIWMTEFSYISASDFHLNADLLEFSRLVAHFAFFHFSTWIRSSMTYPCAGARLISLRANTQIVVVQIHDFKILVSGLESNKCIESEFKSENLNPNEQT